MAPAGTRPPHPLLRAGRPQGSAERFFRTGRSRWRSRNMSILSEVKKTVAPHMWVLSKDSAGGYLVTIGSPADSGSTIKARFSGANAREELRLWVKYDMPASQDHAVDLTGLGLVPEHHTRWYVDNVL